jgi:hypothetical protein
MAISTRQGLADYCLRRLGFPVIEINIDEDQVSDRLDDALQYFREYHFDGVERVYLHHQLTGASLKFTGLSAPTFTIGETLTAQTSGATCKVVSIDGTNVSVSKVSGEFEASEVLTGNTSGYSRSLSPAAFYTPGDIQNKYIQIPDTIIGLIRILPVNSATSGSQNPNNIFDFMYQFRMNDMWNLLSADMIYYTQMKQYLSMLDMLFVGDRSFQYNRKTDKLTIDCNWEETFQPGDYILVECYRILDPNEFTKVYDDMFLKQYSTALIKRQWGENMKKFGGMQLPGGIVMNGQQIYDEAVTEINAIEDQMQLKSELPVDFMVG